MYRQYRIVKNFSVSVVQNDGDENGENKTVSKEFFQQGEVLSLEVYEDEEGMSQVLFEDAAFAIFPTDAFELV